MRVRPPTSRTYARLRFSPFDVTWAALTPCIALYLRSAYILFTAEGFVLAGTYCLVSLVFSLMAFAAFRINDGVPRYLSAHDLTATAKAVAAGELMTCLVLFTFTRLEGIPRSTPLIHALLLWFGLIAARSVVNVAVKNRLSLRRTQSAGWEHLIVIGLNDLAVFFLRFLDDFAGQRQRAIAVLDNELRWIGRAVNGVGVLGPPAHLDAIVDEFATHGVHTDRVVDGVLVPVRHVELRLHAHSSDLDVFDAHDAPFGATVLVQIGHHPTDTSSQQGSG